MVVGTLLTIPARNDLPFYSFRCTLTGVIYTLQMKYNTRMQRWIMDINDSNGNQIFSGAPILIDLDIFGQYTTLAIPVGVIFAVDDTGQDAQPERFSFGLTNTLWYNDPPQ